MTAAAYAAEVLADSPAAFWPCDDGTGLPQDDSGNGHHLILDGGSTAYVTDPDLGVVLNAGVGTWHSTWQLNQAAYTLEAWVRFKTAPTAEGTPIADWGGNSATGAMVMFTSARVPKAYHVASAITGAAVTADVWHHVASTWDGTTHRLYVDAVQVATQSTSTAPGRANSGAFAKLSGYGFSDGAMASRRFAGYLAGAAGYPTALSAARIAAHRTAMLGAAVDFGATATLSVTAEPDAELAAVDFTGAGTLSVTAEVPAPTVSVASVAFAGTGTLDVVARPLGKRRRLVVVDIDGVAFGELENATCGAIKWVLNEPEDWSFTLPVSDPKARLLLHPRFREVQVWRGDQLLAWGPAVRPSADKSHLAVSCKGAGWYLSRRSIGDANRRNYLTNGDFEDGLAGWNIGALHPLEPLATRAPEFWVAHTAVDRVLTGDRALYLAQVGTGAPKYGLSAGQFLIWTVDPATHPEGDEWSFTARCYIPSETWRGPPLDNVGLRLDRFSTTESVLIAPEGGGTPVAFPKPIETITATIDENTPRDVWLPLEAVMVAPVTGAAEFVQVVLYCPDGAIIWDRASLTLDEGLRFHGQDQADIVAGIVDHLQDPAYAKTDLNLWTDTPATGVIRDRTYLHHEHLNGADAIAEFTTLANGLDISVAYTPTTRTLRTHHPAKGTHRSAYGVELGRNVADFAWTFDGESAASQVIVLGSGDGSDREEASATVDPLADDAYAEGLTLETVFTAPPSTLIDSLDDVAAETLATSISPEVLAVTCTAPTGTQADPVGVLAVGDTVPVRIRAGALVIDDTYRIVELTLTPDDTLELTLNKRVGP